MKRIFLVLALVAVASVAAQPVNWFATRWNDTLGSSHLNHFGGITRGSGGYIFAAGDIDYSGAYDETQVGVCYDPNQPTPDLHVAWADSFVKMGRDYARATCFSPLTNAFYIGGDISNGVFGQDLSVVRFDADIGTMTAAAYNDAGERDQYGRNVAYCDYPAEGLTRIWTPGYWRPGGGQNENFAVACFKDNGTSLWAHAGVHYNNSVYDDEDVAVAAACQGETLFVTGYTEMLWGNVNFWTMAFDKELQTRYWQHVWPENTNNDCEPCDILIGPDGYVYVVGSGHLVGDDVDFIVVKYSPDGTFVDSVTIDVDGASSCECRDADIMWDGVDPAVYSIWLTGHARSTRIATVKLSPSLDLLWASAIQPNGTSGEGTAIECEPVSGRVFVAGRTGSGDLRFCIVEYTDGPVPAATGYGWFNGTRVAGNQHDRIGLAVANSDAVYVAGIDQDGTRDLFTIEFARTYSHDVGVTEIIVPPALVDSGDVVTPSCRVYNWGISTAANYTVRMKIGTFYDTTATVTNHLHGTYQTVPFPEDWTALQRDGHTVTCSTEFVLDERNWNDKATAAVFVRVVDVGALAIVVPGSAHSIGENIVPEATWYNHGNEPATFEAWMILKDPSSARVYAEIIYVSGLAPDSDTTIGSFPSHTLVPGGMWAVRCSTWLNQDMVPANDIIDQGFLVGSPDVGAVVIRAPVGRVDSAQAVVPEVWIHNYGDISMSFAARFSISDTTTDVEVYRDSVQVVGFSPGADSALEFPTWPGSSLEGPYVTFCSLEVSDNDPSNDTAQGTFVIRTGPSWPGGWVEVEPIPLPPGNKAVKRGAWATYNDGDKLIYVTKGYKTTDFFAYYPLEDSWNNLTGMPYTRHTNPRWARKVPRKGSKGVSDGDNSIYVTQGNNTLGFWRYDIMQDSWAELQDVPVGPSSKKVKGGTDLAYLVMGDTGWVYCLKGYRCEFYRYNTESGDWDPALAGAPRGKRPKWDKGSWLVASEPDSTGFSATLYAHKAKYNELWCYNVAGDSWGEELQGMPFVGLLGRKKKSKDGGSGAWYLDQIYALKGGNTQEFWRYFVVGDTWEELDTMPAYGTTGKKKRVKYGADIVSYGYDAFFTLKGNKTREFWRYVLYGVAMASATEPGRNGRAVGSSFVIRNSEFVIAPNPLARGFVTLHYSLPESGPVSIAVYDIAGRCAIRTQRSAVSGQQSVVSLDLRSLSPGVYLVRLEAGEVVVSRKLVLQD